MKETVGLAKQADAKKGVSPTRSDNSIPRLRDEPEMQLGSLRDVIGNIRRDGATPSVESIATELSGMHSAQRAPALLALQRTHGNQYVQRVVAGIQAKLKVGQLGDMYEQEADRVAEQVISMPEPQVQRQVDEEEEFVQPKLRIITEYPIQRQVEEEEELLQTKKMESTTPEVTDDLESQIHAIRGGGQPLTESERIFFELRFGADFSQVRVHSDAQAAESAQAVNARAYTVGQDVVFGAGQYAPGTTTGKKLLAHELTHVVQQSLNSGIGFTSGTGMLQRDVPFLRGNVPPYPGVDPEDPFNCERLIRIEGVTRCDADGYSLVRFDYSICVSGVCPGHPDFDPRQHPDYRPEGDEAEILVKYPCFAGRNCTGREYRQKYTHCHNCRKGASGKSLLKPTGCENC